MKIENEEVKGLIKFYESYAEKNGFKLNQDRGVIEKIIKGLLENQKKYGFKYCPCRKIIGDLEKDRQKICPCVWHKKEIQENGQCFCNLFFLP